MIPVSLDDDVETSMPRPSPWLDVLLLHDFALTESGYEHTLRSLTGQACIVKNPLRAVPVLPPGPLPREAWHARLHRAFLHCEWG